MVAASSSGTHLSTPRPRSVRFALAAILAVSTAASVFIFWLIYIHPAADAGSARFSFLPALNAVLNGLSAVALLIGYALIRARRVAAHRVFMLIALPFQRCFWSATSFTTRCMATCATRLTPLCGPSTCRCWPVILCWPW